MRYWWLTTVCFISLTEALVPKPKQQTLGLKLYALKNSLQVQHDQPRCFILHDAIKRFANRMNERHELSPRKDEVAGQIASLTIRLSTICDETSGPRRPSSGMIEKYSLSVSNAGIVLDAEEVWGGLHGLETVIQLVRRNEHGMPVIEEQQIADEPRFIHRGYLIDSSRHFLPIETIKQFLDAMAMVKMNVLHWHIVDNESFPYVSSDYPLLSGKGAYNPLVLVYTQNDVQEIIHHARIRGIRVMAEFDTPGHSGSWGRGYPELLTECYRDSSKTMGPIDPTKNYTYQFLSKLFGEVLRVFPDVLLHLGGDEVDYNCWKSNPDIAKFMEEKQFGQNYTRLQTYYMEQIFDVIEKAKVPGRDVTPVVWQEVFDDGLRTHKNTLIHVWKMDKWRERMKVITEAGYNTIFSACWYLDWISYGADWEKYYECDPTSFEGTPEAIKRVIGGEAALWGEHVDKTNLFSRGWPRGAAVAERLWSTINLSPSEFRPRLDELRCQMLRRGWDPQPANGAGFCPP